MYDIKTLEAKAIKILEDNPDVVFKRHLCAQLGISHQTFYRNLDKCNTIKQRLESNQVNSLMKIIRDWQNSDNYQKQLKLYLLLADDNEFHRLTGQDRQQGKEAEQMKPSELAQFIKRINNLGDEITNENN